jgi:NAD(P)-dependent dehydrogenase (short-subunit alcohol dehydrogenase family)
VYGQSKLANILFTRELARRLAGTGVTVNAVHPGTVRTGYGRDGDSTGLLKVGLAIGSRFFLSPEKGADTSIHLASSPDVADVTGEYFIKRKVKQPSAAARDDEASRRLWETSAELVGLA